MGLLTNNPAFKTWDRLEEKTWNLEKIKFVVWKACFPVPLPTDCKVPPLLCVALEGRQAAIDRNTYIHMNNFFFFFWSTNSHELVFLSFYGKLAWYPTGTFFFLIIFVLFLLIFWRQFAKDKRRSGLFALRPLSKNSEAQPTEAEREGDRDRGRERERELNEGGRSNENHVIITQNPNKI